MNHIFVHFFRKTLSFALFAYFICLTYTHCAKSLEQPIPNEQTSWYFDTNFLRNYAKVSDQLKTEGFKEGFFSTQDNLKINYLFLTRPKADYNVIICSGWLPGRKEGLATIYGLLEPNCNILYFDARGHGKSEGPLFSKLWQYGQHEYKDVIAALDFLKENNTLPVILYGTCAGAFHATHAIINLKNQNKIDQHAIKGLIFDSGWASVSTASKTAPQAKIKEIFRKNLIKIMPNKDQKTIADTFAGKTFDYLINGLCTAVHTIICRPILWFSQKETSLSDKIKSLTVPILFIHSYDDEYAPIKEVQKLADSVTNKTIWWIKKDSRHACHHLKHAKEYQKQMQKFINQILPYAYDSL